MSWFRVLWWFLAFFRISIGLSHLFKYFGFKIGLNEFLGQKHLCSDFLGIIVFGSCENQMTQCLPWSGKSNDGLWENQIGQMGRASLFFFFSKLFFLVFLYICFLYVLSSKKNYIFIVIPLFYFILFMEPLLNYKLVYFCYFICIYFLWVFLDSYIIFYIFCIDKLYF